MNNSFYAHSHDSQPTPGDKWQLLAEHLAGVARLARQRAEATEVGDQDFAAAVTAAAIWHDAGKYRPEFQRMLRGEPKNESTRHKQAGAAVAFDAGRRDIAFAIAGHHGGLPDSADLKELVQSPGGRDVARSVGPVAAADCAELAAPIPKLDAGTDPLRYDLWVRLLFSCLVDADWADTGEFQRRADGLPPEPALQMLDAATAEDWLPRVLAYIADRAGQCRDARVGQIRRQVLDATLRAAELPPGLFSMTVPTGGGKTLASLAFSLSHARRHGLRRVIYVAPFLSIIEQNAREIRRALQAVAGSDDEAVVFEHHSLAEPLGGKDADEAQSEEAARRAENWSAPVIVTTSVQFFESLFSNQPGQCRKLHNIARSVVILDECQTLPPGLVGPTCSMLRGLAEFIGTSIVLCTATQPAWHRRDDLQTGLEGVREIVSAELNLFEKLRRVRVRWPKRDATPLDWPAVAALMRDQSSLCIVNTKKAALAVFEQLRVQGCRDMFHLSTTMCPAHRLKVLDEVRWRLKEQQPCRLVSTQLIEAGVDVDFPLVLREMAPLEAIVQSAGRCNREGLLNSPDGSPGGQVVVFRSVEGKLPTNRWYSAGRDTLEQDFIRADREPDVASTADMQEYFRRLYRTGELDSLGIEDLRRHQQFGTIWKGDCDRPGVGRYRLIDDFTVSVVAATWALHRAEIDDLLTELRFAPSRRLFRQLARFQVNLQPHQLRQSAGLIVPYECGVQVWRGKYDESLGVLFEPEEWDNVV